VAGLAEQHDPAVAEAVEHPAERRIVQVGQRLGVGGHLGGRTPGDRPMILDPRTNVRHGPLLRN
jgi:hypothetical protein